jgi:hypothetical protein
MKLPERSVFPETIKDQPRSNAPGLFHAVILYTQFIIQSAFRLKSNRYSLFYSRIWNPEY